MRARETREPAGAVMLPRLQNAVESDRHCDEGLNAQTVVVQVLAAA